MDTLLFNHVLTHHFLLYRFRNEMAVTIVLFLVAATQEIGCCNDGDISPRREEGHTRIRIKEHANGDENQEGNAEPVGVREERRFKRMGRHDVLAPVFTEILL